MEVSDSCISRGRQRKSLKNTPWWLMEIIRWQNAAPVWTGSSCGQSDSRHEGYEIAGRKLWQAVDCKWRWICQFYAILLHGPLFRKLVRNIQSYCENLQWSCIVLCVCDIVHTLAKKTHALWDGCDLENVSVWWHFVIRPYFSVLSHVIRRDALLRLFIRFSHEAILLAFSSSTIISWTFRSLSMQFKHR